MVRRHLLFTLIVTCVTAWFSYAYFHNDEHFQIIEYVRAKRGDIDPRFLPWEHAQHMRPWLQPALYWLVARALAVAGVTDIFHLAFVFRLLTGLANVGALALFLRTTLPWMKTEEEKLTHLRVATLAGFLPYLFVRTSSESASMALAVTGFALLLEGAAPSDDARTWSVPSLERPSRALLVGLAFGLAFEMRFQTALLIVGLVVWLVVIARARTRALVWPIVGGGLALGIGALADRWGYGVWTFPPWSYVRINLIEGTAQRYGTDPPFAYLWLLPGNVFFPLVTALVFLAGVAWSRCPRHPLTWTTLPFFVLHNLLAHKEERFLFPLAVFATAFVTMALGPSFAGPRARLERIARWGWERRATWPAKLLAVTSFASMLLLAFYPLGWNQNARFMRYVHDACGDELTATALPEVDLTLPAFHPRHYDVENATAEEVSRRIEAGTARRWLISDWPVLHTGTLVDTRAELAFSELPGFDRPWLAGPLTSAAAAYNAHAPARLRRLKFRSLYRIP